MPQQSDFNIFNSDYDKVNRIDSPTWEKKKIYDETPFLILPNQKFVIKLGDTKPDFKCFIRKGGEQFGDSIPFPNLINNTCILKIYDYNYNIVTMGTMLVSNEFVGELTYSFDILDFAKEGIYFFEVEIHIGEARFTLPSSSIKYEIIVRK